MPRMDGVVHRNSTGWTCSPCPSCFSEGWEVLRRWLRSCPGIDCRSDPSGGLSVLTDESRYHEFSHFLVVLEGAFPPLRVLIEGCIPLRGGTPPHILTTIVGIPQGVLLLGADDRTSASGSVPDPMPLGIPGTTSAVSSSLDTTPLRRS